MEAITSHIKGSLRSWNLECIFVGLLGAALAYIGIAVHPHLSIIEETIVLVVFLGALLGIAPIAFPDLSKRKWLYPIIAGLLSAFMDSFLVLLMVAAIPMAGSRKEVLKFKAYAMVAALIGGLLIYFGEVYALPHYLKYGMTGILDGLPLLVPVLVFLGIVGWLVNRLKVNVKGADIDVTKGIEEAEGHAGHVTSGQSKRKVENIIEFVIGIGIILFTHNPILALGVLFVYAFVSGQGEDLLHVIRTETEMSVMLLLFAAWLIFDQVQPLLAVFTGMHAIWPSMVNAVFSGALLPAGGDVWIEIVMISAGALFLPISSLVGVMLFKTAKEWWAYMKISVPLMIVWLALGLSWFMWAWPHIEPAYFSLTNREGYEVVTEEGRHHGEEVLEEVHEGEGAAH